MYLPKVSRNGATDWSMPMLTALNSFGVARRVLADVV